jgi:Ser/Thr protein kinase RdoA (MazF antagonist)
VTRAHDDRHPEFVLAGGTANPGLVVRVGDTVRRPATPASPAVHALLRHLERVGFEGAPRSLGTDERGRDVLEYVEGEVPTAPYPSWALTDEALASVGSLLRRYHRAVASFDPGGHRWLTEVPAPHRSGLICHNDPNLDNVVFRGGVAVALIDFELASPGSPVWDVALAARLWVPLRDPSDVPDGLADRATHRLRLFADAYGLGPDQRAALPAVAHVSHTWCYDIIRAGAARGQTGYARYWTPSAREHDVRGQRWLEANRARLTTAIAGPG